MMKFVGYSEPSTNISEFLTCIYEVKSLKGSDQISLAKQEKRLKNMKSFNTNADKYINKLK